MVHPGPVRRFFAYTFLCGGTFFGIYAVLFNLLALELGFGIKFVGFLNASSVATLALTSLPMGHISRRMSLRRAHVIGLSGAIGGHLLLVAAAFWTDIATVAVFAGNLLAFCSISFLRIVGPPFLFRLVEPATARRVFTHERMWANLGGFCLAVAVMPLVLLIHRFERPLTAYGLAMLAGAGFLVLSLVLFLQIREGDCENTASSAPASELPDTAAGRSLVWVVGFLTLVAVLIHTAEAFPRTFYNTYLKTLALSVPAILLVLGLARLVAAGVILFTGSFLRGRAVVALLALVHLVLALAIVGMASIDHVVIIAGLSLLFTGANEAETALSSLLQVQMVPRTWQTTMSAVNVLTHGVGSTLVAQLGGLAIAANGYATPFWISSGLAFASIPILILAFRKPASAAPG